MNRAIFYREFLSLFQTVKPLFLVYRIEESMEETLLEDMDEESAVVH
ncbi:uncharacterized protein METZ01_LOCUS152450 [marine metagenome]|uniref:Uncharacterized protein n=1 Tax=marine metagenome TaxID=408172 RepID=A0A382ADK0_9ZZZZ